MSIQRYDVIMAAAQGRCVIRRGDLAAAERWFKLADRACAIAARLAAVQNAQDRAVFRRNPVY